MLVLEGEFTTYDRFVYLPIGANERMLKVWQAAILALFLQKELIDQAPVNMLKDWKHSGFSIERETRLLSKTDRETLGQYVVRGTTYAEKIQYDEASDTVIWTASPKGFYKGKSETFKGFEWLRRQNWARLLQKVYEVNPCICPKCQVTMTVVPIIEDPAELAKIIEWAKKQEQEALLSVCARSTSCAGTGIGIIPKNAFYAEQDTTSKSALFGSPRESYCLRGW